MILDDLRDLTADELAAAAEVDLEAAVDRLTGELRRRRTMRQAVQITERSIERYLRADGRGPGAPWVRPGGAYDAYPEGWTVTHAGRTWESLRGGNDHEPGVSGWREVVPEGQVAGFVQPSGAHDAYTVGDLVAFEGKVYRSTYEPNTWSPADYPAGWELVP